MEVRRERREGEQERHSHTKFDKKRQKKKTDHSRRNGQKLHQKKIADPRPAIADQTTKSGRLRRSSKRDKPRELPVLSDAKKPETEPRHTLLWCGCQVSGCRPFFGRGDAPFRRAAGFLCFWCHRIGLGGAGLSRLSRGEGGFLKVHLGSW